MLDRPLETPPTISNKKIHKAAAEYQRLVADHQAAVTAAHDLEQARHTARDADTRAYADAIRAGKDDPGQPATQAADNAILLAGRREEALEHAVTEARNELVASVDQHRAEWLAALEKRLDAARDRMREAVDQVSAAHAELAETFATRAWLEQFPEQSLWRPGRFAARVPALLSPAGEPVAAVAAISALRELAEPPPAPAQPAEPRRFSGSERRWVAADAA